MPPSLEELHQHIENITSRNERVESDKAWETSWTRRALILVLTYLVIAVFFFMTGLPNPLINAVVPSLAFVLSTLTLSLAKKWWLKNRLKKS